VRGDPLGQALGADRQRGDRRDSDGGTKSHNESRADAGPEQPLGERKDEDKDRARAGSQADRYVSRQSAFPATGTDKVCGCGRASGRVVVVVVVSVVVVPGVIVRRAIRADDP